MSVKKSDVKAKKLICDQYVLSATLFVLEMNLYRHEPVGQRQLQSAGTWLCTSRLQPISARSLLCIVYSDMTHIEMDLVRSVFVITSMFITAKHVSYLTNFLTQNLTLKMESHICHLLHTAFYITVHRSAIIPQGQCLISVAPVSGTTLELSRINYLL